MSDTIKAPFPYFGGKSLVAPLVWERFGNVRNYVEPFFGSGAVLLGRPCPFEGVETVNDLDGMLANFWRAVAQKSDETAAWADWPVNENDLTARHLWLVGQKESLQARLEADPDWCDPKIAGWWVWGACAWIGSGWCSGEGPWRVVDGELRNVGDAGRGINRQMPHVGNAGRGVNRKMPHVGDAGRGVNRQMPHVGNAQGINRPAAFDAFAALSERLRRVRVCCGDWSRVVGDSVTWRHGLTGVFLDPPYADGAEVYAENNRIGADVMSWAIEAGKRPDMRIAVCGYEGEHETPEGWECVPWKAKGGYGSQGDGEGRKNARRERIWFSPHCLSGKQRALF